MTPFSALLASLTEGPDGLTATIGDDWRQGRTLYGGLSAALCVEAARRALPEAGPLRAAQFAFVGPASGVVTTRHSLLRKGKSTAFASVDLQGDAGLATRATLCFAARRASSLSYVRLEPPAVPAPDALPDFFDDRLAPAFSRHFAAKRAGGAMPVSGAANPDLLLWIRHRDASVAADATALVAIADAAPPAAMTMFTAPAPISTMTWSVDVLADPTQATMAGWILMRSTAQTVANGYSTQAMFLWDQAGQPLMSASQCVAVFT